MISTGKAERVQPCVRTPVDFRFVSHVAGKISLSRGNQQSVVRSPAFLVTYVESTTGEPIAVSRSDEATVIIFKFSFAPIAAAVVEVGVPSTVRMEKNLWRRDVHVQDRHFFFTYTCSGIDEATENLFLRRNGRHFPAERVLTYQRVA